MNNREQLLAAIHRQQGDRVPYTYDATAEADQLFRRHLRLGERDSVARHFRCNEFASPWTALGGGPRLPEREARFASNDPNVRFDIWGIRREPIQAGNSRYFEIAGHPLAHAETVAEIENYDWPTPGEVVFPEIPQGFDLAAWKKDRVVLDMGWICPFGVPWSMRGLENIMLDLVANPALVEAIVARVEEFTLGCLQIVLEKYGGLIDLIGCGDDYGTEASLFMSKAMIDRFFMPSLQRHYALGKKHGVLGYHHCDGAIFDLIPSFIAAGVDLLNPVQTSAAGMDPARLKAEYGRDLAFHGGMDIQHKLVESTPAQVREEVRRLIDTLGPTGYIFAPCHALQTDTPPANLVAMYEEVASSEFKTVTLPKTW